MANLYFNGPLNAFRFDPSLAVYAARDPLNPILPAYESNVDTAPQLDVMRFGDGYMQVAPSSAQRTLRTISLTFSRRPTVVIRAIRRFLDGEPGVSIYNRTPAEFFFWQPPNQLGREAEPMGSWIVLEPYQVTPVTFGATTLSVKLTEWRQP
jgi:phage-related protein